MYKSILLILISSIATVVVAQPDETKPHSISDDCYLFGHCWQPGEHLYSLKNSMISDSLSTVEEIKVLSEPQDNNEFVPAGDAENGHPVIQLATYEEEAQGDSENKKDTDQSSKEAESDVPLSPSGNIYSHLKRDELQKTIADQREAIQADTQLTDAVRASRLQVLTSANEALIRLNEFRGQKLKFDNLHNNHEAEQTRLNQELEMPMRAQKPEVTESTVSEDLIRRLKALQSDWQNSKDKLSKIEAQINYLSERVSKIPEERSVANDALEKINDETAKRTAQENTTPDNQLALLLLEIRRQATVAELAKLDSEEKWQEHGSKINTLERDVESRRSKKLQEEVASWELAAEELRQKELVSAEQAAREEAETAHHTLRSLAERNEDLVLDRKRVVNELQILITEMDKVTAETESILKRRTEIENKIEAAGLTGTNGMELVDLRRNLSTTGESYIRIRQLQTNLRSVNLTKVELNKERDELSDFAAAVKNRIGIDENHKQFNQAIEFMRSKKGYLDQLIEDYRSYGRKISVVSESRKKLIDEINKTVIYIDKNAIWIRSSEPIEWSDFGKAKGELTSFFDSHNWATIVATTQQRAIQRPYETSIAALTLVILAAVNRRVKRKLIPTEDNHEPSA